MKEHRLDSGTRPAGELFDDPEQIPEREQAYGRFVYSFAPGKAPPRESYNVITRDYFGHARRHIVLCCAICAPRRCELTLHL